MQNKRKTETIGKLHVLFLKEINVNGYRFRCNLKPEDTVFVVY